MDIGRKIQNRYVLERTLGVGGMAEVWLARDERLQRPVAIKILSPGLTKDPEFLVRFFSEAQGIARIQHPNVVSVLDFGEVDDRPFLVMEYVQGGSLADLTGQPMAADRALPIARDAAAGAGAAHDVGIVHRDIKPANILLTEDRRAKLADFGIATPSGMERLTATGLAIGSPHYISPEQASARVTDPRADVYSLGIVLYELLTGVRPFEGDNVTAVAIAQVEQDPEPLRTHVADIDPDLEALVLACLAKDPDDRPADGSELATVLQGLIDRASYLAASTPRSKTFSIRRRRPLVAAGILGALALGGGLLAATGGSGDGPAAPLNEGAAQAQAPYAGFGPDGDETSPSPNEAGPEVPAPERPRGSTKKTKTKAASPSPTDDPQPRSTASPGASPSTSPDEEPEQTPSPSPTSAERPDDGGAGSSPSPSASPLP